VICQCACVNAGRLREALRSNVKDVDALSRATGAGTLCGSCLPALSELCGSPPTSLPLLKVLSGAGILTLLGAAVTLVAPRVPVAKTVFEQGFDALYTTTWLKQSTGFALVAFLLFGLVFSLRKRFPRFQFSSFRFLRVVHGCLGMSAVLGLFLHTGYRLGSNLNLVLMIVFLTSASTGALSALVERGTGRAALFFARLCKQTHEATFWPLAPLTLFHALKSYYF
jgi:nitrite reductase (NADH) large subunit